VLKLVGSIIGENNRLGGLIDSVVYHVSNNNNYNLMYEFYLITLSSNKLNNKLLYIKN
jgi:hypothetical protein